MPEFPVVDFSALPKLAAGDLRLLWVNDWYDGPLEAVVELAGERCLMVLHRKAGADVNVEEPMQWVLYRLLPAQWAEEERWHALFEEHVGHHWCFNHEATPEPADARDTKRFYESHATRTPRSLGANTALGWVDEMPAH